MIAHDKCLFLSKTVYTLNRRRESQTRSRFNGQIKTCFAYFFTDPVRLRRQ